MRRAILLAVILTLLAGTSALASDPPNPTGVRLVSGGGRIWEGAGPGSATADVTFSGFTAIGAPGSADGPRCEWRVHFRDVSVDDLDGAVARSIGCTAVVVLTGTAEAQVRSSTNAELDGVPGYLLGVIVADGGEAGRADQVRIRLRDAATNVVIWDTPMDFTIVEAARTALDAGNIQSWTEP